MYWSWNGSWRSFNPTFSPQIWGNEICTSNDMLNTVSFCQSLGWNTCFPTTSFLESHHAKHSTQTRSTGEALEMNLRSYPSPTVLVGVLQRTGPIGGCVYWEEIYFTELAHAIVVTNKPEIHKTGQLVRNSGRISVLQSWDRIPSSLGNLLFCS